MDITPSYTFVSSNQLFATLYSNGQVTSDVGFQIQTSSTNTNAGIGAVNTSIQSVQSTVNTINSTTNTIDTNLNTANSNIITTNSNVTKIISTPISGFAVLSQGSVLQTVYAHNGPGTLKMISYSFGAGILNGGIRLTIDGTVYAYSIGLGGLSGNIATQHAFMQNTNPYSFTASNSDIGGIKYEVSINYKSTILIEAYCNSGSSTERLINYVISNNV